MKRSLFRHSTKATFNGLASTWHNQTDSDGSSEKHDKQAALNEAYDEYCRLRENGADVLPSEFCQRYPTYRKSLRRLIDVHDSLESIPDLEQDSWPDAGQEFLGFEILHELGIGAIARVYLAAEHALGGRFVAVKVSPYGDDEADTLGKLSHPNVVPVHSVQVDPDTGMTAVCMPYLGSATLADVLDLVFAERDVPVRADVILTAAEERDFLAGFIDRAYIGAGSDRVLARGTYVDGVVHLGVQLAEALAYTHSQGILHRDLKPSNVLLAPNGRPMLLDFNLSCDLQMDVNRVGGTLPYMPSEQIREVHLLGGEGQVGNDPRSDIFSLGVILYELLTGQLPFGDPPHDSSPQEAGAAYLEMQQKPPTDVRQLNPQVDRRLTETINSCLSTDLTNRPESAAELSQQLNRRFAAPQRLKRWSYQRRWILTAAATLLVGGAAALIHYVVTLPPLELRMCDAAVAALREGQNDDALAYIEWSLDRDPDFARARFVRARIHHLDEEYSAAAADLKVLKDTTGDPFLYEYYAYCLLKNTEFKKAAVIYQTGMQVGEPSAAGFVNAAYAWKYVPDPVVAESCLERAIALDPEFAPAYHLFALVRMDLTRWGGVSNERIAELKENAVLDIDHAIGLDAGGEAEFNAAIVKAYAGRDNQILLNEVRRHLESAIHSGHGSKSLGQDAAFELFHDEPWFQHLLKEIESRDGKPPELDLNPFVTPPVPNAIDDYLDGHWRSARLE